MAVEDVVGRRAFPRVKRVAQHVIHLSQRNGRVRWS